MLHQSLDDMLLFTNVAGDDFMFDTAGGGEQDTVDTTIYADFEAFEVTGLRYSLSPTQRDAHDLAFAAVAAPHHSNAAAGHDYDDPRGDVLRHCGSISTPTVALHTLGTTLGNNVRRGDPSRTFCVTAVAGCADSETQDEGGSELMDASASSPGGGY